MSRLRLRLPSLGVTIPTLAIQSTLGAAPLVLQWSDTAYVVGQYGQLQIASDSGFSTITQNIVFFIDGSSWSALDESIGLATPSGAYWAWIRTAREDDLGAATVTGTDPLGNAVSFNANVSGWSNVVNDTISASVAALNTVTGVNKNSNVTVSGSPALTFACSSGNGGNVTRSTIVQASSKAQFEVTVTTTGDIEAGVEDGTTSLNTNVVPGINNSAGVSMRLQSTSEIDLTWNAQANNAVLNSAAGCIAVGDVFALVIDTTAHTAEVWRTRSATSTQMGTTQTIPTLSAYYAFAGSSNGNAQGTVNFGGTTYAKTPGSGVASIWA